MKKRRFLVLLAAALTLGLAASLTFSDDQPAPPEQPAPNDPSKLTYQCSYADGGANGEEPRGVYAVNVPTEESPALVTDLYSIANIYLSFETADYVSVQVHTSPADPSETPMLLAEGMFSTQGGFTLAVLKDGTKLGTLACGYIEAEQSPSASE